MSAFEIFVAIYMAAVPPVLGYLFWGRMNRLESRMDSLERGVASDNAALRSDLGSEIAALRSDLGSEIAALRSEMRQEITALRSDLTQVALAVGARPRSAGA